MPIKFILQRNRITYLKSGLSVFIFESTLLFFCQFEFANAEHLDLYDQCLLRHFEREEGNTSIDLVRQNCTKQQPDQQNKKTKEESKQRELGAISNRILSEKTREFNPYVITPHRMNFILPVYTTNKINQQPYSSEIGEGLKDIESKFQISLKVPLSSKDILANHDGLYFGFTVESLWQTYSGEISRPFRETNYRPEIFYITPLPWQPFGGNTGFSFGLEHQSNGQSEDTSRSWNRMYASFLYEKGNLAVSLSPWWRLSEEEKQYPGDPKGDDNPDISTYFGYHTLSAAYRWSDFEVNMMNRWNFATEKGAVELGFIFPLTGRLRGYVTFFEGYGDSLIDYNHYQTRIGLGIALTGFL